MPATFNRARFARALKGHMDACALDYRRAGAQVNLSAATLNRYVNQEVAPNVEHFARLCAWMKIDANLFLGGGK